MVRFEQPAAMTNHPDRIVQAQRTGDAGGRDLAQTMADHGLRLDAHERHSAARATWIANRAGWMTSISVQPRPGSIGGRQFGEQRPVSVWSHRGVAALDGLPEHGFLLQQMAPHAKPLAALPRKHEDKFCAGARKAGGQTTGRYGPRPRKKASRLSTSCSGELPVTARRWSW